MPHDIDNQRDELLLSLYEQRIADARLICDEVIRQVDQSASLSESDQKSLNQILVMLKKAPGVRDIGELHKIRKAHRALHHRTARMARTETVRPESISYETWLRRTGLRSEQLDVLWHSVTSFQLTVGCSHFCRRCNEWALPGVRRQFTADAVKTITRRIFESGNSEFVHYGASDPLDWKQGGCTFRDIVSYMQQSGYASRYGFLTKIPRGTVSQVELLAESGADFAVSVTAKNRKIVETVRGRISGTLAVQHDSDDLMIPAGRDEDFQTVKSSITDNYGVEITPDGVFCVLPTFTSPLQPTGQARIPVTADSTFLVQRRTGRDALPVEYFKPLAVVDFSGRESVMDELMDPQVENILLDAGQEDATPPGMMGLKEYFQTFEPAAVAVRKKLIPSVIRDLRRKALHARRTAEEKKQCIRAFRRQAEAYLASCRQPAVMELRKQAVSFYLAAIVRYLKRQPVRGRIILHLRRNSLETARKTIASAYGLRDMDIESLLEKTEKDAFPVFQYLVLRLLENPDDPDVARFLNRRHPIFDRELDRFMTPDWS